MKIALLGSNQLALTVAWSLCHSEVVQDVVYCIGTQYNGNRAIPRGSGTSQNLANRFEDITLSTALSASDTTVSFTNASEGLSDSDVVVLLPTGRPAGFRSKQVLQTTTLASVRQVLPSLQEYTAAAKILVAVPHANTIAAWIHQNLETAKVIGLSNSGATAYLKSEIARRLGLSVKDVAALTIGNDEVMHPLPQYCRVNGIPLTQLMPESDIQRLCEAVVARPSNITEIGEYTLANHIYQIVSAIGFDKKRIMSIGARVSTDTASVFLNVPSKIGSDGVESIVPLELTAAQREQFKQLVAQSAAEQDFH